VAVTVPPFLRITDCTSSVPNAAGGLSVTSFTSITGLLADPVAGVAMVPIIAKEGADAVRGKGCEKCGCG